MTLIAIALFGLLFVAVFGAKAAQSILKFIGVLFALFICAVVLTVVVNANRVPAPPASSVTAVTNAAPAPTKSEAPHASATCVETKDVVCMTEEERKLLVPDDH